MSFRPIGGADGDPALPWSSGVLSFPAAQLGVRLRLASVACWGRGIAWAPLRHGGAASGPAWSGRTARPVGATTASVASASVGSEPGPAEGTCGAAGGLTLFGTPCRRMGKPERGGRCRTHEHQDAAAARAFHEAPFVPFPLCGAAGGVTLSGEPCRAVGMTEYGGRCKKHAHQDVAADERARLAAAAALRTCGDGGGLKVSGEPCGRRARVEFGGRCSQHAPKHLLCSGRTAFGEPCPRAARLGGLCYPHAMEKQDRYFAEQRNKALLEAASERD